MPSGGARRGRRDNGLVAAVYAAVGDVDPRVGEHLLAVLAGEGIAAYLQPAADLHPITRTTTLPSRPTDRLYADREHLTTALGHLALVHAEEAAADEGPLEHRPRASAAERIEAERSEAERIEAERIEAQRSEAERIERAGHQRRRGSGPDPEEIDLDTAWAGIIASFEAGPQTDATPWPAAENVADADTVSRPRDPGSRRADSTARSDDAGGPEQPARSEPARSEQPARPAEPAEPGDPAGRDGIGDPGGTRDQAGTGENRRDRRAPHAYDQSLPDTDNRSLPDADNRSLPDADDQPPPKAASQPPPDADNRSLLDALDTFGADLPDDDERYTPPPPPPLPRLSRTAVLALVSISVGATLFFFPELLPIDNDLALLLGFGAVLAGFVALIWRLRPGGDDDDIDPDDGAVV